MAEFEPGQPRLSSIQLSQRPKNVIVIVLESVSARYLNTYGYPLETAPQMQRLAPVSVTVDSFYSTGTHTIATALPLCGGLLNDPHTLATVIAYPKFPVPKTSLWMSKQGYQTCFLGAGGHSTWERYRNIGQIFVQSGWDLARDDKHPFWAGVKGRAHFHSEEYLDPEAFADAQRYLRTCGDQKFFMLLWNYDTHSPYYAPDGPTWDDKHVPEPIRGGPREPEFRRFLHSIRRTDALIGALHEELERLKMADDTLIVVTGDHGEAFGQHGTYSHGGSLYDEEVRVPLVMINRPLAKAVGNRLAIVGSHIDVWPTISDVCGFPADPQWQGRSLLGGDADDRRAFMNCGQMIGVREGRFKYMWEREKKRDLLFDLIADPDEMTNLADEHPAYCIRQRRRLRDWTLFQTELTKQHLAKAAKE